MTCRSFPHAAPLLAAYWPPTALLLPLTTGQASRGQASTRSICSRSACPDCSSQAGVCLSRLAPYAPTRPTRAHPDWHCDTWLAALAVLALASAQWLPLALAGELLDVDGVTGGHNFQSCWTTGMVAGTEAANVALALRRQSETASPEQ